MSAARRVEKITLPTQSRPTLRPDGHDRVDAPGIASRALSAIRPEDDRESMLLLGLSMLAIGLGFVWLPLALIVPGGIVTLIALAPRKVADE